MRIVEAQEGHTGSICLNSIILFHRVIDCHHYLDRRLWFPTVEEIVLNISIKTRRTSGDGT